MQQIYRRIPMSKYNFNKVASEHLFLGTLLGGCFCIQLHLFVILELRTNTFRPKWKKNSANSSLREKIEGNRL